MSFSKFVAEAKRISNVNNYLYKSNRQSGDRGLHGFRFFGIRHFSHDFGRPVSEQHGHMSVRPYKIESENRSQKVTVSVYMVFFDRYLLKK